MRKIAEGMYKFEGPDDKVLVSHVIGDDEHWWEVYSKHTGTKSFFTMSEAFDYAHEISGEEK